MSEVVQVHPETLGITHICDGEEVITGGQDGQVWIATFADPRTAALFLKHADGAIFGERSTAAANEKPPCPTCGDKGIVRICCQNPVNDFGLVCCENYDTDGCPSCKSTGEGFAFFRWRCLMMQMYVIDSHWYVVNWPILAEWPAEKARRAASQVDDGNT